jgi:hypothetical protein
MTDADRIADLEARLVKARKLYTADQEEKKKLTGHLKTCQQNNEKHKAWITELQDSIEAIGALCNGTAPREGVKFLKVVGVVEEALADAFDVHRWKRLMGELVDLFEAAPETRFQGPEGFPELLYRITEEVADVEEIEAPGAGEAEAGAAEAGGRPGAEEAGGEGDGGTQGADPQRA